MELFFANEIREGMVILEGDEFRHCCKVLRNKEGDIVHAIDGKGLLMECRITSVSSSRAEAEVLSSTTGFGAHGYRLAVAAAPTKNNERYEWFLEKAVEMGIDRCIPLICEHSESKTIKKDRLERIVLSAAKQSLKAELPEIDDPMAFKEAIKEYSAFEGIKAIAYCGEEYRREELATVISANRKRIKDIGMIILIGPEGDFSKEEATLAASSGFVPVSIGSSRLRTETAAMVAVAAVYTGMSACTD